MTYWRLEWLRLIRTGRWIALAAVFLLLGLGQPLATTYLGSLLRGATGASYIQLVVTQPGPADAMASYFSNITTLGTIVVVVVASLAFALRSRPALAAVYLTHEPSRVRLLAPRLVTVTAAAVVATLLGGAAATLATTSLLGAPRLGASLAGIACSVGAVVFEVGVTFLCATLLRSQVAVIATALIALLVVVPLLDLIPGFGRVAPGVLINLPAILQTTAWSAADTGATLVTLAVTVVCVVAGLLRSTRWEL